MSSSVSVKLYKIRWLFLVVISSFNFLYTFSAISVSQINNIFVHYFHVTYAVIDWATIANLPGVFLAAFVVLWLTYNKYMEFKAMAIVNGSFLIASSLSKMIAFASHSFFPFVILGQFLSGFSAAIGYPMCLSLALSWFPIDEAGTAIGISLSGTSFGLVLGTLLPSHSIVQPTLSNASNNKTKWQVVDRNICLIMWSVQLFFSILGLALIVLLASNHPPTPPTLVQEKEQRACKEKMTMKNFLSTCKILVRNKQFLLIATAVAAMHNISLCEVTMMTQLMMKVLRDRHSRLNHDVISSYASSLLEVGGLVGTIVSGRLIDKFNSYKILLLVASSFSTICSIAITIAYRFNSYEAFFGINPVYGFFNRFYLVCLLQVLTQITYPINSAFVGATFRGYSCLLTIVKVELGRVIFNFAGGIWLLSFETIFAILAVLLTLAVKLENNRLNAEQALIKARQGTDVTETSLLINQSENQ